MAVSSEADPTNQGVCLLEITNNPHVWSGVPVVVPIEVQGDHSYIRVDRWLRSYSVDLLVDSYQLFNDNSPN